MLKVASMTCIVPIRASSSRNGTTLCTSASSESNCCSSKRSAAALAALAVPAWSRAALWKVAKSLLFPQITGLRSTSINHRIIRKEIKVTKRSQFFAVDGCTLRWVWCESTCNSCRLVCDEMRTLLSFDDSNNSIRSAIGPMASIRAPPLDKV